MDNQRSPGKEDARDLVRMGREFLSSEQAIEYQPRVREIGQANRLRADGASIFRPCCS
jgi:hypothetical protein